MTNDGWIDIATNDGSMGGFLTLPPTGTGPGILLLQEIFGVNSHIRAVAQQYAADGFVVLAPDLFWRRSRRIELAYDGDARKLGFEHLQSIGFPQLSRDVVTAGAALRGRAEVTGKTAALGFCAGGTLAFLAAADGAVDLAVSYYGGGTQHFLGRASEATAPLLFHFGGADAHISADAVAAIREAFAHRPDVDVSVHEGAQHGFNCWARDAYSMGSALTARGETLSFLAKHRIFSS
jgi:carboxymethylenebutenolidase